MNKFPATEDLRKIEKAGSEWASRCTKGEKRKFRTTEKPDVFERSAAIFYESQITCGEVDLSAT
ncbi:MAG: hypothetical protein ACWGQW_11670, partial [bacterium]